MNSTCTCGCCEGIAIAVPENTANRPGLPALLYRAGTYATFLETMIARLSSRDFPALAALRTRDPADPSIALLDSWAVVADVLTFYQERIANEGYLRTATERRSILELARLIGYKLRPGVAATVYLAYTLDEDRSKNPPAPTRTSIPAGARSQSVPGPRQLPQSFETSDDLDARSDWNILKPRLTQPQLFTLDDPQVSTYDPGTDVAARDAVYFSGTSTNLNPGDPLLFVIPQPKDPAVSKQALRLIQSVEIQTDQKRTEVILQTPALQSNAKDPASMVSEVVTPYFKDAATLFANNKLASQAAALLSNPPPKTPSGLLEAVKSATNKSATFAAGLVQQTEQQIAELHDLAVKRNFTRLKPWLGELLDTLGELVTKLQALDTTVSGGAVLKTQAQPPLANLAALILPLSLRASIQPPNSLRLQRTFGQTFSSQSDIAPKLLGAFTPAAAPSLYAAWNSIAPSPTSAEVGAVRAKAGLFPGAYPGTPTSKLDPNPKNEGDRITSFDDPPTIRKDWTEIVTFNSDNLPGITTVALDSVYDKILIGSWIVIDRPNFTYEGGVAKLEGRKPTFHQVLNTSTASLTTHDSGFSAKVTKLDLRPPWLGELDPTSLRLFIQQKGVLSGAVVLAQTEILPLGEEPLDIYLEGDSIELDDAYDGLESGRWIIVSGERTDIENVTGVTARELVMIQGVAQVTTSPNGQPSAVHTVISLANKLAYTYDINTVTIYGNVVKATHGETRNEVLGNGDGSLPFQQFKLKQKPLTFVAASNPTGTDTTLEVYVNNVEWHETDTLAGLSAKDRSYITQTADDDSTTVTFGNGREGARLPTGNANVKAIYRNGIGQPGNVNAEQISLLQTRPLNAKAVINPIRASGGADRDTRDQARRNAPLAVMALDRLVSIKDYADFARTFAGIGKANSLRLSDGQRDLVHVTIAGAADIPIDYSSDLYTNLVQALRINGDPYLPIEVAVRRLRLMVISATVKILPDYLWEPVASDVRAALLNAFSFDNRDLGQPAFQSEAISIMQAVEGVGYVDLEKFDSVPEDVTAAHLADLATSLKLRDYISANLARTNPNPVNYPADSILAAELVYLSSDIPDMLILNQVKS
jgi:hypothetical protein